MNLTFADQRQKTETYFIIFYLELKERRRSKNRENICTSRQFCTSQKSQRHQKILKHFKREFPEDIRVGSIRNLSPTGTPTELAESSHGTLLNSGVVEDLHSNLGSIVVNFSSSQPTFITKVFKGQFTLLTLKSNHLVHLSNPVTRHEVAELRECDAERRKIDAFDLWCWKRLLRVLWTTRRSNQFILKEIIPGCSLDD